MWFSKININTRNLKVSAGQALPAVWQNYNSVLYLRKNYGNNAFFNKNENEIYNQTVITPKNIDSNPNRDIDIYKTKFFKNKEKVNKIKRKVTKKE